MKFPVPEFPNNLFVTLSYKYPIPFFETGIKSANLISLYIILQSYNLIPLIGSFESLSLFLANNKIVTLTF